MKKLLLLAVSFGILLVSCKPENSAGSQDESPQYNRELQYTYTKDQDGIEMEVYLPSEDKNINVAVIACPGGGYSSHAAHEGAVWAPYFNDLGVAFAVLKYTLPQGDPEKPINDIEQALNIFNDMADKWLINRSKIGVMGFSAGGHLACYSATTSDFSSEIRPDFQILLYPVITMGTGTHNGSRDNFLGTNQSNEMILLYSNEMWTSKDTPKTFISYAKSETTVLPAYNGKAFYDAMIKSGAEAELLPLEGDRHGWHHNNTEHESKYLNPLKAKLTPWLLEL